MHGIFTRSRGGENGFSAPPRLRVKPLFAVLNLAAEYAITSTFIHEGGAAWDTSTFM